MSPDELHIHGSLERRGKTNHNAKTYATEDGAKRAKKEMAAGARRSGAWGTAVR